MLTKRQLEEAGKCSEMMKCENCSMYKKLRCTGAIVQTALAYREMLEKMVVCMEDVLTAHSRHPFDGELAVGFAIPILHDARQILKESEGE